MSIPDSLRLELRKRLWSIADQIGWFSLSAGEKAKQYEIWTRDPEIGGTLARYMDPGQIRVYLKDTLLKDYGRIRLSGPERPMRVLDLSDGIAVAEIYIKPHGRRLADGRVFCWGRADDWKSILMAVHERSFRTSSGCPFAVILMFSSGRYRQRDARSVVEDAAKKLGIEKTIWLD
jgi:hypothetical protein